MMLDAHASRWESLLEETRKIPAFFRRDVLTMWSYRFAFVSDWLNLITQIVLFYLIDRLIQPSSLPSFAGRSISYIEFAAVGIAVTSFMQVALSRVIGAVRNEQLMGTLEYLLTTPTAPTTIQLGSVLYDLIYVPVRSAVFLALASVLLDVDLAVVGILPALAVLSAFVPLVWGIGMVSAAGVLTFRRGTGVIGFGIVLLGVASSTYVPLEAMPGWVQGIASVNPISITLEGVRGALLGGAGWEVAAPVVVKLVPIAAVTLTLGVGAFRMALSRERRLGTLGQY